MKTKVDAELTDLIAELERQVNRLRSTIEHEGIGLLMDNAAFYLNRAKLLAGELL